jgi:hypothetical protein
LFACVKYLRKVNEVTRRNSVDEPLELARSLDQLCNVLLNSFDMFVSSGQKMETVNPLTPQKLSETAKRLLVLEFKLQAGAGRLRLQGIH